MKNKTERTKNLTNLPMDINHLSWAVGCQPHILLIHDALLKFEHEIEPWIDDGSIGSIGEKKTKEIALLAFGLSNAIRMGINEEIHERTVNNFEKR